MSSQSLTRHLTEREKAMADVKWIKIVTDIFDDEKIRFIETMPNGDELIVIWFKILCLAGKCNSSGFLMFTSKLAYTDEMLASIFNRDIKVIQMALATFENLEMIEITEHGICIAKWNKHQSLDKLEAKKLYDREYHKKKREEQKLLLENRTTVVRLSNDNRATEEDKDKDKDIEKERTDYIGIKDAYNTLCPSLPAIKTLSDARKRSIKARLNTYTVDDLHEAFRLAEESDFLKGKNDRNWTANFDWIIKDANLAKILDGNYVARKTNRPNIDENKDDLDDIF